MKKKLLDIWGKIVSYVKSSSKLVKIILGVIVLLLICFIFACTSKKTFGNETGNLFGGGLAAKRGSWIYYLKSADEGIYKAKGNKTVKVSSDSGKYLNISGSYIFYAKYNEERQQYDLVKMKTNGKKTETLIENIDENVAVTVVDKWIYYSKSGNFTRCNQKGDDKLILSKNSIEKYQISGSYIYYSYTKDEKNYIAKMKLNGENNTKISKIDDISKENYGNFYVKDSKIYFILREYSTDYSLSYSLHSINLKGEQDKEICELSDEVSNINMTDNGIYYIMLNDDIYEIRKIGYNGKNDKKIAETETSKVLNILGNYIVYSDYNKDDDVSMFRIKVNGKDKIEL